ncbi:isopentenyl-diphosphate Delta-isomerase [Luteimicrobium subarcticum]|uniref:Isopentenyl-diphosphate Delta-isomerase n=1 Tax=Luteimicrobium subarcticum TaxID=620910 RepID=A0A2M8WTA9_9MICO|nr:isopentenyl-diphosphate Delta-isomerase [Luteimicrobium subarcticum]PJI94180.1 isopentenyl-diphosphate delta-isomerase [Luteimicrobium subarcticum]
MTIPAADEVVLVDREGVPVGTAPRTDVHRRDTPRHLAFSCHVLTPDGHVVVTRRALAKRTWPGAWTNAFCGHPRPGEHLEDAVRRRASDELGVEITDLRLVLPTFSYEAVDDSGVRENELCPVYVATLATPVDQIAPDPDEVAAWRLVRPEALVAAAAAAPWTLSPWSAWQLAERDLRLALGVPVTPGPVTGKEACGHV